MCFFQSKSKSDSTKKRATRTTSNVFAMFTQTQIQEFKEVTKKTYDMIKKNFFSIETKSILESILMLVTLTFILNLQFIISIIGIPVY